MKALRTIAITLVIIGGLNWGLIAINADWNLVTLIFGAIPGLVRLIYALVGVSALYVIWIVKKMKKA